MILKKIPFIYKICLIIKHSYLSYLTKKSLRTYLKSKKNKCLQVGSGENELRGWFNTDFLPRKNIAFLDVTKKFKIPAQSFDYVFSEHHIEHIHYKEATFMLQELYNIIKKGGVLRICTPDLSKYLKTYFATDNTKDLYVEDIMNNWIKKGFHNAKNFVPNEGLENITFFINDLFYNYEHKFIYDEITLTDLLKATGFRKVYSCKPSMSAHEPLNGIESHVGITMQYTLVIEAIK